ncbi:MAG: diaminopimelate epimerase, partial [Microlunatus sp.]|nr:diaminopimelate epimerase [Microlunatus sp.]
MGSIRFAKGHGTENDFVIIPDPAGRLKLTEEEIRFICDRRAGIGADGVLRVVKSQYVADWDGEPDLWFMDYHNHDGSVAEMCGNGVRVFARYLIENGLADGPMIE